MVTTMTNDKDNSLFNTKAKNRYLEYMISRNLISQETKKSYVRIFGKTKEHEEALNKDLNLFNLREIEDILFSFKANNRNTIESYGRIISSYLNWSVSNGLSKKNPMIDLNPTDFEKYLTNEEIYFTDKQLRRWEDMCENYQDAVILRLLFNGVGGKQLTEIRNLKKSDVDTVNGTIKLTNTLKADAEGNPIKFTERSFNIDERTAYLLQGAMEQKTYVKRNGHMEENPHVRPYTDLVSNKFVVRPSITKTEKWDTPVDKFVIYRRVQVISDTLGINELTTKFIQRSGMIFHSSKLMGNGDFSLDDMKMVADRFNLKSYHNLKGFLTTENIKKVYPKGDI